MSYFDDSQLQERIEELESQVKALQSANEALGAANTGLALNYQQAKEYADKLAKQLPDEMQDCTIRFKECPSCQRGWLQPDNWVDHGCPHCARDALQTTIDVLARANADLTKHRDELVENAQQHERRMATALHDRLAARDELSSVRQAYSSLLRQHERLREAYGVTNTLTPGEPVAADEHGPIYKDDLCPDALRDGFLKRSAASKARRTAKPPKQEGDIGITFTEVNECTRKNCPTEQPHRHFTKEDDLDHIIAARRARMMATIADADSDAFPTKENPNHVKADLDHQHGALDQLRDSARMVPPQHTINNDSCLADVAFPEVMDANNIVGGPNEPALAAERRQVFEQAASDVLNRVFPGEQVSDIGFRVGDPVINEQGQTVGVIMGGTLTEDAPASDETSNTPDKGTEQR